MCGHAVLWVNDAFSLSNPHVTSSGRHHPLAEDPQHCSPPPTVHVRLSVGKSHRDIAPYCFSPDSPAHSDGSTDVLFTATFLETMCPVFLELAPIRLTRIISSKLLNKVHDAKSSGLTTVSRLVPGSVSPLGPPAPTRVHRLFRVFLGHLRGVPGSRPNLIAWYSPEPQTDSSHSFPK